MVEPYFIQGKAAIGNLYELDFREHAAEMAKKAVRVSEKEITFEDGFITRTPFNIGWGAVSNMVEEHGNIVKQVAVPQDPDKLHDVLAEQRQKRYAMKEAKRVEILLPLTFAEQNAYNAVKEAHPASLICFAQHGYYELYGDDAEKASAVLGTKCALPGFVDSKNEEKQKETQDILSYHTQAAGCSDKARAKASGGRQPIEECGRTGL